MAESTHNTKKAKPAPLSERFKKLGLVREWDFLLHLPLRYEDRTAVTTIAEIPEGTDVQVAGTVLECTVSSFPFKKLEALIEDDSGCCRVYFRSFYPSTVTLLEKGNEVLVFGRARLGRKYFEFFHPKVKKNAHEALPRTLDPIYPTTQSIQQHTIRNRIKRALLDVTVRELLTEEEKAPLALPGLSEALHSIHRPSVDDDFQALLEKRSPAWLRLKFDECFAQQLLLRRSRQLKESFQAARLAIVPREDSVLNRFISALPFELTGGQKKAWKEVVGDLARCEPMNRLVQGDVGCGKTVIAALACALAIDNGKQVAFMAPTEILAAQHYAKVQEWFRDMPVNIVFLSGRLSEKEKREARKAIQNQADIVIGTHALVEPNVVFRDLALAIIDEQHRFGVLQRLALRSGSEKALPHLLMLSATPIPRSLAMTYLADLQVSIIDELPAGRRPIQTLLTPENKKEDLLASLERKLASGAQIYWVCPLVTASEKVDLANAEERFAELKEHFKDFSIGLLHGQMGSEEKNTVMNRFSSGEIRLLVSTTVIEVGVDVKNATVMVIEQPERFGLAQLHQLRGRVGRGSEQSFCIGVYGQSLSISAQQRLEIFRSTTDGFVIAEADLKMRGPGDFLGARQSGSPLLRFSEVSESNTLINYAITLSERWIQNKDERITAQIQRWFSEEENFYQA